uniref:NADH dehydrogenase subunit 6 n=1 Tax=Ctenolepisma longicaudatum TaxID=27554 RepID=UPI002435BDF1|nr:NADH dehydrogenase subunit 6 [Ctenolepisma longicaudatum]WEX31830.1 NADH dehydrogenase subunit 6 [Ctenolepisma longicaudatum]
MCMLMLLLFNLLMTRLTHPLSMGLTLITNTIITSLTVTTMSESPWFSYILFLIFLGGMLVLFIYVTSLASNEKFHLNTKTVTLLPLIAITISVLLMMDPMLISTPLTPQDSLDLFINNQEIPAMKFYSKTLSPITLTLATYLFVTLIAVVKVTNLQQGPLRMTKT